VFDRKERAELFRQEVAERETVNILDRALLKAEHSRLNGALSAVEYHKLSAKVDSLKKLAFTEDYERLQDRETYEFMKYKVAAEVGGAEEKEAFRLYQKTHI
jgi:hypothetical protein